VEALSEYRQIAANQRKTTAEATSNCPNPNATNPNHLQHPLPHIPRFLPNAIITIVNTDPIPDLLVLLTILTLTATDGIAQEPYSGQLPADVQLSSVLR